MRVEHDPHELPPATLRVAGPCACGWPVPARIEVGTPELEPVPSAILLTLTCPVCARVYRFPVQTTKGEVSAAAKTGASGPGSEGGT